jgi:hypothetical protein
LDEREFPKLYSVFPGTLKMPEQRAKVTPIRPARTISVTDKLAAELGFEMWLSSGFRVSPELALLTSMRILTGDNSSAGLFVVPKRTPDRYPVAVRRYPGKGAE